MLIGGLRNYIDIQQKNLTQTDGFGEQQFWFSNLYTNVPSAYEVLQGREAERANSLWSEADCKFTIRHHANITTTHSIVFNNQRYNITACIPDAKNRWLTLYASTDNDSEVTP